MTVRIAMWSGPRNISTAMMRSFENRPDCAVIDEPFYAAYLAETGIDHPMRAETLASQPLDRAAIVADLIGPAPDDRPIFYQKHMTHHMPPGFDLDWMARCRNAFLIRDPAAVLASYAQKRGEVTLDDIGVVRQRQLFDHEADRLGRAPPVLEGAAVLADPQRTLSALCTHLDIPFSEAMLAWPAGRRDSDGVWGAVWYEAVERSTGFAPPENKAPAPPLNDRLRRIADQAQPHYEALARYRIALV